MVPLYEMELVGRLAGVVLEPSRCSNCRRQALQMSFSRLRSANTPLHRAHCSGWFVSAVWPRKARYVAAALRAALVTIARRYHASKTRVCAQEMRAEDASI